MKNILLIGLGRFGKHIAIQSSQLGHEIMAVDLDEERVNDALPYVTNAQIGDSTSAITSNNVPMVNAYSIDCPASFFSLASSPAPFAFDAIASTATAIALGIEWISQPMVVVVLTAAVAFSPRCPTIAVSTY